MKYLGLVLLSTILSHAIWSQDTTKTHYIQFSGVLVSSDSLDMVSYANIIDKTTGTGTVADYYGYFSLVTKPGDTLLFNAFGFKENSFIIPDTLTEPRYSIIHIMTPDTLILPEVDVYPWPSREAFAKAFVEMDPYEGQLRKVQRELSKDKLATLADRLPADPGLAYNYARMQRQTKIYTQGITPVNNLMNPASWAMFIQSWRNGDLQIE